MTTSEIQQQINLKQTELNYTHDPEKRKSIQVSMSILKYRLEIERIRDQINALSQH